MMILRHRRHALFVPLLRALVAAALVGPAVGHATEPAPHAPDWIVVDSLPCASPERIAAEVDALVRARNLPSRSLRLELLPAGPGSVRLRLFVDGVVSERTLPLGASDCKGLAPTVALVVRGWLDRPWRSLAEAFAELDSPPPPNAAPEPPQSSPPPAATDTLRRWSLALQAGGYAGGRAGNSGFLGGAAVEFSASRAWGVELAVESGTAMTLQRGIGSVSAQPSDASLRARWSPVVGDAVRLDLLVGPRLERLAIESSGFPSPYSDVRLDVAAAIGARLQWAIGDRLSACASADFAATGNTIVLNAPPFGTVLTVAPARFSLLAGVRWSLD